MLLSCVMNAISLYFYNQKVRMLMHECTD